METKRTQDGFTWVVDDSVTSSLAYGGHEAWLLPHLVTGLSGVGVIVEVGAHVGTWTLRMARYAQRVIAFEPAGNTRRVLMKNVALNGAVNVEVRGLALGFEDAYTELRIMPDAAQSNLAINECHNELQEMRREGVRVRTLPSEVDEPPELLKLDVEGHEKEILGACPDDYLMAIRRIVIEHHDLKGSHAIEASNYRLETLGFTCQTISPPEHPQVYTLATRRSK